MENLGGKVLQHKPVELQASGTERTDSFGELQVLLINPMCPPGWVTSSA